MKRKIIASILALCMVIPLLPLAGVFSFADGGIPYYDENGDLQYYTGQVAPLDRHIGDLGKTTWLYVNENVSNKRGHRIFGDVHIILGNGITWETLESDDHKYSGLWIAAGSSVTFYAQSLNKNEAGTAKFYFLGGIYSIGDITINGGNIIEKPTHVSLFGIAGIGYAQSEWGSEKMVGGRITINNGYVNTTGSYRAAGIGGANASSVAEITINGGEVIAKGGYGAPGIGTGMSAERYQNCTVNINGGKVTAIGGDGAPGIGSAYNAHNDCTVNINGGEVVSIAGTGSVDFKQGYFPIPNKDREGGAGIGGAVAASGKTTVNITGGKVTASAIDGAGIGSGTSQSGSNTVNITGGDVHAESTNANGIGNGVGMKGAHVSLSWTDAANDRIYASSYAADTSIDADFAYGTEHPGRVLREIGDAAGVTIRPFLYSSYVSDDRAVFLEMLVGFDRVNLTNDTGLPILQKNTIYVVNGTVEFSLPIIVPASSVIYLRENAVLKAKKGILVYSGENALAGEGKLLPAGSGVLTVIAEKENSGKLICSSLGSRGAAIGGGIYENNSFDCGLIQIHSGKVEATGAAGFPAIGGKNATVKIFGGEVCAKGGSGAPGVGGVQDDTAGKATVEVRGGRVIARGGTSAQPLGLGAGSGCDDSNADVVCSWTRDTDGLDTDPGIGSFSIVSGKEFKYLKSAPVQAASAENINAGGVFAPHASTYYIDGDGVKHTVDDFIELSNNGNANSDIIGVDGGWYVCVNGARDPLQIRTITVTGTMNLILTDGTELRPDNIVVNPGATLNVYGQYAGTGVLRAFGGESQSGIGGSASNTKCGTVNIYGGRILANASLYAAAIGGAGLSGSGGTVSIYGGDVQITPHADKNGKMLGIGDGWNQSGAVINYYGGRIDAGAVCGTVNFKNHFNYEDDGTHVFADEYDPSRVIVPGLPEAAEYVDENGEAQSTYDYKRLHGDTAILTGIYYVYEDITLTVRPEVSGTAALILKDGVTLNAEKGIGVNEGGALRIYAHSADEAQTGALIAGNNGMLTSAIGGDGYEATGSASHNYADALGAGDILIAGGRISAQGGIGAAGIGSGNGISTYPKTGGSITVTGGFIDAGATNGPAIGAGGVTTGVSVNISGGVINAVGGGYSAGIGTNDDTPCTISISGGKITAKSGLNAGTNIGSKYGGTVTVSGGVIDASDSTYGAVSIGHPACSSVTVSAGDPGMSLKYASIRAANVVLDGDFAYGDGTPASVPLANNRTLKPISGNFASVTFRPANGEEDAVVYVPYGHAVSRPAAPEREGYTFTGWYEEDAQAPFDFDGDIDRDTVLTARWDRNYYTVTFDPGSAGSPFTQSVEHGEKAAVPAEPEQEHADFDGWYAEGAETPYDFETPVTGPLTLTARWTYETFTVTYHNGSDSYTEIVSFGAKASAPALPPETGFTTIGWRIADSAALFDFDTSVTSDLDLLAVNTFAPYSALSGTYGTDNEGFECLVDGSTDSKWCISDFDGAEIEFSTDRYIVPDGYVMYTANDTDIHADRNPVSYKIWGRNSSAENWELLTEAVDDDTLGATSCTPYVFSFENKKPYRFFKLQINAVNSTDSYQVFQLAEFAFTAAGTSEVPGYTVSFNAGEGSGTQSDLPFLFGDEVELPECEFTAPEGKIFIGWSDGTETYREYELLSLASDLTLTAVYADKVVLTYSYDGNTSSYDIVKGAKIRLSYFREEFTLPAGMEFKCWKLGEREYAPGTSVTVNEDLTFEAVVFLPPPLREDGSGGYYSLIPVEGIRVVDLADKPKNFTFKVYDDGKNNNYSNNCDGYLHIIAPSGMVLMISGTGSTENGWDFLYVYDGIDEQIPVGDGEFTGAFSIGSTIIENASLLIRLTSDSSGTERGCELTVTTVDPDDLIDVFYIWNSEGTANSMKETAVPGIPFNLAAFRDNDGLPEGRSFKCWQLNETDYAPGALFTANARVIFYAVIVDNPTVTLDGNGAELKDDVGEATFSFPYGTTIDLPELDDYFTNPPSDKLFGGWSYGETVFRPDDPFTLTEDVVFKAEWMDPNEWQTLEEILADAVDGDVIFYQLQGDAIASANSGALYIPQNVRVGIDLNGHRIDRRLSSGITGGYVFYVEGELTVLDMSEGQTGVITGGYNSGEGGGVYVERGAKFTLNSGTITGNRSLYGAGVEVYGTFVMTGGTITGNVATDNGGGVEAYGDDYTVILSGSAKIKGNALVKTDSHETVTTENNVALYHGQFITVNGFDDGARIGISYREPVDEDNPFTFTKGLGGAPVSPFFADDGDLTVEADDRGEARLAVRTALYGDVDGDGNVNIGDVTALLNFLATTSRYDAAYDLDNNLSVNIDDVTALLNYLAGNA
ncbi:MAG: InlB B-repeat-containing protein [Clostridia bacterium]|nr:InlB B-repeat-containing protein [Clostridia bacterium]